MLIKVKNLRVRTFIGIYDWEKRNRQELALTYSILIDGKKASINDKIEDTLNYETISNQIFKYVDENQFDLIEKVANDVLGILLEHPKALEASIEVEKPGAVKQAESVSVFLKQTKEGYLSGR